MNTGRDVWAHRALLVIALAAVFRLVFLPLFPLGPDETSYWTWSKKLDYGYVDHPPLIAYAIRVMTAIFGDTYWAARLLACALAAGTGWIVFRIGRTLYTPRIGFWAATLYATSPAMSLAGGMMLLPEGLLAFFVSLGLLLSAKLVTGASLRPFARLGPVLGLALLSKYPGILILLALGLFAMVSPARRQWFKRWPPYAMAVVGLAMFAPVVVWNAQHDGAGWAFLNQRTAPPQGISGPLLIVQAVITQAAYHSPVTFALLLYGAAAAGVRWIKTRDERALLLFCFSGPVIFAFLVVATIRYTLPHWPAAGYIAAYVAAPAAWLRWGEARVEAKPRARVLLVAAIVGAVISAMLPLSMVYPMTQSPPYRKLARVFPALANAPEPMAQAYGWDREAPQRVREIIAHLRAEELTDVVVLSHDHLQASLLAYGLRDVCPVMSLGPRAWQFEIWYDAENLIGRTVIYISSEMSDSFRGRPEEHYLFDTCTPEPDLPIVVHGRTINTLHLWVCRGFAGLRPRTSATD